MFNHHFFDESEGRASYLNFLSSARQNDVSGSKLLVVVDPPFGAMVELLLFGLFRISKDFFADHFRGYELQIFEWKAWYLNLEILCPSLCGTLKHPILLQNYISNNISQPTN